MAQQLGRDFPSPDELSGVDGVFMDELSYIKPGISPEQAGKHIGHDREFVMELIDAGELTARDERSPGAKIPRYRIDPDELVRWLRSRQVKQVNRGGRPKLPPRLQTSGLVARTIEARRIRRAAKRVLD